MLEDRSGNPNARFAINADAWRRLRMRALALIRGHRLLRHRLEPDDLVAIGASRALRCRRNDHGLETLIVVAMRWAIMDEVRAAQRQFRAESVAMTTESRRVPSVVDTMHWFEAVATIAGDDLDRKILEQMYLGFSSVEIAAGLHCSPEVIRQRLHRMRRRGMH